MYIGPHSHANTVVPNSLQQKSDPLITPRGNVKDAPKDKQPASNPPIPLDSDPPATGIPA
jgi:hypothetical protein